MGNMVVLKSFAVVILGGMGNFYGAAAAGLLLGITEALTAGFITSDFKDIFAFVLVIIVILFRPEGIFARRGETYETYE
jgi:branched-chain amino acid transport system permease protein